MKYLRNECIPSKFCHQFFKNINLLHLRHSTYFNTYQISSIYQNVFQIKYHRYIYKKNTYAMVLVKNNNVYVHIYRLIDALNPPYPNKSRNKGFFLPDFLKFASTKILTGIVMKKCCFTSITFFSFLG